ncbi:hypothetical protein [Leptospira borgpetersenii]|uniref:hypothetical protein n=1 Tax=Leptospira borgpetersenii TaxID=174 RepID=UPI0012D8755F|nr:hypothetical protein [Leptospira borgpetersenii]
MSLSQNVGTSAVIHEDSDKIEWFWDRLYVFFSKLGSLWYSILFFNIDLYF